MLVPLNRLLLSMRHLLKMLRLSGNNSPNPTDGDEATAEADEPPDDRRDRLKQQDNYYMKEKLNLVDAKKESLLTRALLSSPEPSPIERSDPLDGWRSNGIVPILSRGNSSTSASGDDTALKPSNIRSMPRPGSPLISATGRRPDTADPRESEVEANLGRKRCITFACARRLSGDDQTKALSDTAREMKEPPVTKRKSALTFVCPAPDRTPLAHDSRSTYQLSGRRPSIPLQGRRSPAPHIRKSKMESEFIRPPIPSIQQPKEQKTSKITVTGLGEFKLSDATRFYEFGSSIDDDEDWVNENTDDKPKITMSDCMRKEDAIRKLGEEVEDEVRQAEEEEKEMEGYDDEDEDDDDDDDDDNDEDGDGDDDDGDSTVHDGLSDDGNESDNEAGFASGDDSSDENSEFNFWTPGMATAATSVDHAGSVQHSAGRKNSNSSIESRGVDKDATPVAARRRSTAPPVKLHKHRPATPDLPDSTDFVCGTLDEDRPLEAAYKSCMEERRLSKRVPIPQDIDPSFPTSDPEDDDNDDDLDGETAPTARRSWIKESLEVFELRGRKKGTSSRTSPSHSPKSRLSPPKKLSGCSPRRLRSPAPVRRKSPAPPSRRPSLNIAPLARPAINITGLAQRGPRVRTKSLPRTPNPFFARLESRRPSKAVTMKPRHDRSHTRGPIDIVAGLEKKRQKRKEKFWRQHCRKAAKEQQERRPLPGKGAERMKELGLEVAERFRAYGFGFDTQLVLSI